jgi:hypothetical protein
MGAIRKDHRRVTPTISPCNASDRQSYSSCTSAYANRPIQARLTTAAAARPTSGQARSHNASRVFGERLLSAALMNSPLISSEQFFGGRIFAVIIAKFRAGYHSDDAHHRLRPYVKCSAKVDTLLGLSRTRASGECANLLHAKAVVLHLLQIARGFARSQQRPLSQQEHIDRLKLIATLGRPLAE